MLPSSFVLFVSCRFSTRRFDCEPVIALTCKAPDRMHTASQSRQLHRNSLSPLEAPPQPGHWTLVPASLLLLASNKISRGITLHRQTGKGEKGWPELTATPFLNYTVSWVRRPGGWSARHERRSRVAHTKLRWDLDLGTCSFCPSRLGLKGVLLNYSHPLNPQRG